LGRRLKFVQGHGFELDAGADPRAVLQKIIGAEPGLNQSDVLQRAAALGVTLGKGMAALKDETLFRFEKGERNNEKRWYPV
jgi:hypothetical protein